MSNYFYRTNGIYQRACDYLANLYRYDWYIAPQIFSSDGISRENISKDFIKISNYLDNSQIKKTCSDIALKVIKNGAYYGYKVPMANRLIIQELPCEYCRSRFFDKQGNPVVEFNMKFFNEKFPDIKYRQKILKLFPKDFQHGYMLYMTCKLPEDCLSRWKDGWYTLDTSSAIKFSFGNDGAPILASTIPYILDLDVAQEVDRLKQMQQLSKILIQKLPLDKNGDLIFDVDEAKDIHDNAVKMVSNVIGADVMTTFAEVDAIDMSDTSSSTRTDDLERVERAVYNNMGLSRNLFNADGNIALSTSILDDEATMRTLLLQFGAFFDAITVEKNTNQKKCCFRFCMLETTQYNYKELSKLYKDQTQLGFSKVLPQIALGHSQSMILNTAYFENEILQLSKIMIPPMSSATMNAESLQALTSNGDKTGRPTNEEKGEPVSDKTIQNQESLS